MPKSASCINARVEAVDTKPAFRSAFKKRRCLVMADGFYEWRKTDKQPRFISLKSSEQMAFAGSIVNALSAFGHVGAAQVTMSVGAKHAVEGMTKCVCHRSRLPLCIVGLRLTSLGDSGQMSIGQTTWQCGVGER